LVWELDPRLGDSVVRVRKTGAGDILHSAHVSSGKRSEPIALAAAAPPNTWSVFANYSAVGFEHIVPKGLDHILFIVGLFLLSPRLKTLLWQVTSFTLAHSLMLALSMLGVLQLPSSIVEPLIALSIAYVAVENIMTDRLRRLQR
jgi:hydrogenase/urease accessory protein HupE